MSERIDAARVGFFPPGIPVLVVIAGFILNWLWPISFGFEVGAPARHQLGLALILFSIGILGFWSVILLRKGGQSENPWKPTLPIEERGHLR